MVLVDTCGWIEWLADGALAEQFQPYLEDTEALVVTTVVQFERYKWLERNCGEEAAMKAIARTTRSKVVDLDTSSTLLAAELSRDHGLSFADAIIYASARKLKIELRRFLSNLIPPCLSFRPASVSRQQLHSLTMRLLSLLEAEQKYGAIWYKILRQSPYYLGQTLRRSARCDLFSEKGRMNIRWTAASDPSQ